MKEPPLITANSIMSILVVDYPLDKVACYVSEDGATTLMFEALFETSEFSRKWVPFYKKFNIELRALEWLIYEALNTMAYEINLSPSVPLRCDVPDEVWFGKDVSYGRLFVFGCKAFVHVPKDERSKLDVKTHQCIFICYVLDEKDDSQDSGVLTDMNLVPLDPSLNPIQDVHCDVNDGQMDIGDFDAPIDDVVNDQQQAPIAPPAVPLRRSSGNRRPSIRYSSYDYVLLTDEGELNVMKRLWRVNAKIIGLKR
ncbi:hypothetical protein V6N12_047561 [Hibiscus sabdariffa]|uniref:Retroviral polymerase SH3-like domain-containing protein n=1 Tax=Hibiscus sabdariffa TaxID=183260 RepID=A0ABR2DC47_9ROSI